ncbi:MAG: thioredoxin family protein [Archangium sp.]
MSATTFELTEANFEETLKKPGILFIDFWAGWCQPCLRFAPTYEAAAQKHGDITFAKVDTQAQEALAAAFEIQAIPTLAVFRDGIMLGKQSGALPAAMFEEMIQKVREINMDEVKQKVAEAQAAAKKPDAAPAEVKS